jgi:2-polyprenyl-3-methyl-5-hydroxy-6-metoxy-1,4-benzoquinol methylase
MTEAEEVISRWDACAEQLMGNYTAEGDSARTVLLNPILLNLLEDVKGKKILDAGCGEGYFSRLLIKQGAIVTGVDFSTTMLNMAKSRTPPE